MMATTIWTNEKKQTREKLIKATGGFHKTSKISRVNARAEREGNNSMAYSKHNFDKHSK